MTTVEVHQTRKPLQLPSPGRIVHFWPDVQDHLQTQKGQPLAAIVCAVLAPSLVNLTVFAYNGLAYPRLTIPLWQGEGERPEHNYASWPERT